MLVSPLDLLLLVLLLLLLVLLLLLLLVLLLLVLLLLRLVGVATCSRPSAWLPLGLLGGGGWAEMSEQQPVTTSSISGLHSQETGG